MNNEPLDFNKITWWMPESILGALWDDAIQRIIVFGWYLVNEVQTFTNLDPNMQAEFQSYTSETDLRKLVTPTFGYNSSTGDDGKNYLRMMIDVMEHDVEFTTSFKNLLRDLRYYFRPANSHSIPVYFVSGRGYDYLLSNFGIEIVFPEIPDDDDEIKRDTFRLYQRRRTGKYALYLPPLSKMGESAENPKIRTSIFKSDQHRTVRFLSHDNNVEAVLFNNQTEITQLIARAREQNTLLNGIDEQAIINILCPTDSNGNRLQPTIDARLSNRYGSFREFLGVSFETFKCISILLRKWQIPGSVFRQIAFESQKLKAELWLERSRGISFVSDHIVSDSDNGCRKMISENLEVSFPNKERMLYFHSREKIAIDAEPDLINSSSYDRNDFGYRKNEIYIHNEGISFPNLEDDEPSASTILASWKNGVAANPLFSDSTTTS